MCVCGKGDMGTCLMLRAVKVYTKCPHLSTSPNEDAEAFFYRNEGCMFLITSF